MGEDKSLLEPGELLDNRYEVVRKLAEGGMASIYLVRHLGLHSLHALKVPDPRIFHSADARHHNLQAFRVLRTCNKTGTRLSYQYMDDERNWSEPLDLEPGNGISHWMTGYNAQVPVRVTSLKDGVTVEDKALAGMVVGRMPDIDADWRPWENQLVPGQDNGLQLKPVYRETGTLRGASQAE